MWQIAEERNTLRMFSISASNAFEPLQFPSVCRSLSLAFAEHRHHFIAVTEIPCSLKALSRQLRLTDLNCIRYLPQTETQCTRL